MNALRGGVLAAVLLAGAFLAGWWVRGRQRPDIERVVETRIDTVYYERPVPAALTQHTVAINVPRVLFATALAPVVAENATAGSGSEIPNTSGGLSERPAGPADSVSLALAIETRIYEDSLYRAEVSGPVIGQWRPSLDRIELYARTNTVTQTVVRRNRFAVTAGVGAAYTPRGIQPTVGVQVGVVLWGF